MKVNVSSIIGDAGFSINIDSTLDIPSINFKGEDIPVNSPVRVAASITNTGDYLLAKGMIYADLTLVCSRCLDKFSYHLKADFEEKYSDRQPGSVDGEEDINYFEGDSIDLTDDIIANILLSLPMKYICSENCKGLCPHCGKNLNTGECNCTEEDLDPRLEILKNLLKDNKEV